MTRIAVTPRQVTMFAVAGARARLHNGGELPMELLDHDELTRQGLDLPAGTVQLTVMVNGQKALFLAVDPDGHVVEWGGTLGLLEPLRPGDLLADQTDARGRLRRVK